MGRRSRVSIVIWVLVCAYSATDAAASGSPAVRSKRTFTEQHGLPSSTVFGLAQHPQGPLWIATTAGLARFESGELGAVRPDLFSAGVSLVAVDRRGALALTDSARDALWIGNQEQFASVRGPDGRPLAGVVSLCFDREDRLWLLTREQQLFVRDPTTGTLAPVSLPASRGRARHLEPDREGGITLAREHELWRRDLHGAWSLILTLDRVIVHHRVLQPDRFLLIGLDQQGRGTYWLHESGRSELLYEVDARPIDALERLGSFFLSFDAGLAIIEPSGRVDRYDLDRGELPGGGPLLLDHEGSVWLGAFGGLFQYAEPDNVTWGVPQGLPHSHVRFISRAGDTVFVQTWRALGGLEVDARSGVRPYTVGPSGSSRICRGPDDRLWTLMPTESGRARVLSAIDRQGAHRFSHRSWWFDCSAPDEAQLDLLLDRGIVTVGRNRIEGAPRPLPPGFGSRSFLASSRARFYLAGDGRLCDASRTASLADALSWRCRALPDAAEILDVVVAVATADRAQEEVWVATRNRGVLRVLGENTLALTAAAHPAPRVMPLSLRHSPRGGIWICGPGVSQRWELVGSNWQMVERLSERLGLPSGAGDLHEDRDGTLWIASNHGVTRIPQAARDRVWQVPTLRLRGVDVDGQPLDLARPKIAAGHRAIRIDLAHASLLDLRAMTLRTRLGPQEPWSLTGESRINLLRLAPGPYRFEASASLDREHWSEPPVWLEFEVLPAWYARPAVLLVSAAVLAAAIVVAWRLRARRLVARAAQRLEISMDLHDELGAGLASVGVLGAAISSQATPGSLPHQLGERIAVAAAELGASLHDIIWSLRSEDRSLAGLAAHLSERGRSLFASPTRFETRFPSVWPPSELGLWQRRHLQRIVTEALVNSARHAQARSVCLSVASLAQPQRYAIAVEDDGNGFDLRRAERTERFGIAGMRARAARIGAEFELRSTAGQGTQVEVRFAAASPRQRWWRWPVRRRRDGRPNVTSVIGDRP
jgi:signal transduction histidine kinase